MKTKANFHLKMKVNFAKFLRTPFFTEHLWWLLLYNNRQNLSEFLKESHHRPESQKMIH